MTLASAIGNGAVGWLGGGDVTAISGVNATGGAGASSGWLVLCKIAARSPAPVPRATLAVGAVSDDEADEVDVFLVPQVVSLLYPVNALGRGQATAVYAIPQVVNLVLDESA